MTIRTHWWPIAVIAAVGVAALCVGVGCSKNPAAGTPLVEAPRIDADLAFQLTAQVTDIGPHASGTQGAEKVVELIKAKAAKFGAAVVVDAWTAPTPEGKTIFRNVIAEVKGVDDDRFIIVGGHYDSKRIASIPDFAGANDSGSSTGLTLAMINAAATAKSPPPVTLRFLFFDGEECYLSYTETDGLFGSRRYAETLDTSGELKRCLAVIVIDMIGDSDLRVTLPRNTQPVLGDRLLNIVDRQGTRKFFGWHQHAITDDHTPFQRRGVPAIDLIDFEFGPGNRYWHTSADRMDKISPASLKIVGDATLQLAWEIPTLNL